jgi:hypothetical protein
MTVATANYEINDSPDRAATADATGTRASGPSPRRRKADLIRGEQPPPTLPVNPDGIPAELKALPQWVCWLRKRRDGKWTKIPINPRTGANAKPDDPATWGTFGEALALYQRHPDRYAGVGFVFAEGDPYTGVDLDDCVDPGTGAVDAWGRELLDDLGGYVELSPTRTGAKAIVRGAKPGKDCRKQLPGREIEMYDRLRFFALTGHTLPGSADPIPERQAALEALYHRVFGSKKAARRQAAKPADSGRGSGDCPLPLTEGETARWKCLRPEKQARVKALWHGDTSAYGGDDSRADDGLCFYLLVLTNGDRPRAEQLFGESALGKRAKWTDREDYRDRTFASAFDIFEPWDGDPATGERKSRPARAGKPPEGGAPAGEQDPRARVIAEWLRETFAPAYREGARLYSVTLRRLVSRSEVVPTSEVIDRLAKVGAGIDHKNRVDPDLLPKAFRDWLPVAWGDMLARLQPEGATGEIVEPAEQEFRARLSAVFNTVIALGYSYKEGREERHEVRREPIIDFAAKFANSSQWQAVRGFRIWSKREKGVLKVAFRPELIGQLHCPGWRTSELGGLTHLCKLYGLGTDCKVAGGSARAIQLDE